MTEDVWKVMGKTLAFTVFGAVGVVSLMFLWAALGSFIGFITGWILSKTFLGDAIVEGMFVLFGKQINASALPQVGAFLGFVSGFFKHVIRVKEKRVN